MNFVQASLDDRQLWEAYKMIGTMTQFPELRDVYSQWNTLVKNNLYLMQHAKVIIPSETSAVNMELAKRLLDDREVSYYFHFVHHHCLGESL